MIRVGGAAAAGEQLEMIADAIRQNLAAAVTAETEALKAEAKRRCPVKTGALRDSIRASVRIQGEQAEAFVGSGLPYAGPVELGTLQALPAPFLAPALAARKPALTEQMKRAVRRALEGERE